MVGWLVAMILICVFFWQRKVIVMAASRRFFHGVADGFLSHPGADRCSLAVVKEQLRRDKYEEK